MRVLIDFNAETPDGRFFARLARLGEPVRLGGLVQGYDADGDQMVMVVDEIDEARGVVYLRPEWPTWTDGGVPGPLGILIGAPHDLSVSDSYVERHDCPLVVA